jgi:DNA polymerase-1
VELPLGLDELPARADDKAALRALYERFEFKSWLKDLDGGAESVAASKAASDARRFDRQRKSGTDPDFRGCDHDARGGRGVRNLRG